MSTRNTPIWYPVRDPRAFAAAERFTTPFSRREILGLGLAGALGVSCSGWLPRLAAAAKEQEADKTGAGEGGGKRGKSCILLWMNGGPSQTDTFDLKPKHANGGPFRPIATSAPGVSISQHLPPLAQQMHHAAIVRTINSPERDHVRCTYPTHTGYLPHG